YTGTLLLVSHDRAFLDNVVTGCLVFESEGSIREYVSGYSDWVRQRLAPKPAPVAKPTPAPKPSRPVAPGKLSYNERRELEQRQQELQALTADPAFYKQAAVTQRLEELRTLEAELEAAYERWEALEG
ncbi:MAG: ABC transporter ATP-binding protein, partial [Candidatus Competibacteraceae bacterium]